MTTPTVTDLARLYGALLPVTVRVGDVVTTTGEPPWPTTPGAPVDRAALIRYARETLGVDPFDVLPLAVPEAGPDRCRRSSCRPR